MKTRNTIPSILSGIIAAMLAISLALPGAAWADRDRNYKNRHGYGQHHERPSYKKHRDIRHHYKHSKKRSRYYYYKDDDDAEKLLIGLLVGGLIGYAINHSQNTDDYADEDYNYQSPSRYPAPATYPNERASGALCLQEREYQTTVIIGGRSVDAYGTACLQPDGSWRRGPAQVANY